MVETTRSLEDVDALLQRNWFVERDDIVHLLYLLVEDDWRWIVHNRHKYDPLIQIIICQEAGIFPTFETELKFRDLTEEDCEDIAIDFERQTVIRTDSRWDEYKKTTGIRRPQSDIDNKLYELNIKLQKEYDNYHKKYCPDKHEIAVRINSLKNEIDQVQDRIDKENKDWELLAKTAFRKHGKVSELPQEEPRYAYL